MSYRALDMREHLDEVKNDSQALVVINPLTYKAGYEKFYDTNGNMTWKEPFYHVFETPKQDYEIKDSSRIHICKIDRKKCKLLQKIMDT